MYADTVKQFPSLLPSVPLPPRHSWSVLGFSLTHEAIVPILDSKIGDICRLCSKLEEVDPHHAFTLLRNCFSIPKLVYILRTCPTFVEPMILLEFDSIIRAALLSISNVSLSDKSWKQVSLPNRFGGLGFRSARALSLPCFLSSSYASSSLVRLLFSSVPDALASDDLRGGDRDVVSVRESWQKQCSVAPLDLLGSQRKWDGLLCEVALNNLLVDADQWDRCRFLAAKSAHSAAWSEAVPIPVLGNFLGAEELRVAVVLRVGANIFGAPTCLCKCGVKMDAKGYHGLSCRLNEGRPPRHAEINSIIKKCLGKIGLPSILEPLELDTGDGRRPDSITTFPWKHGKCLVWDATVVDAFSRSHIIASSIESGSSAKSVEILKSRKYQGLVGNFHFQPVAFETRGAADLQPVVLLRS